MPRPRRPDSEIQAVRDRILDAAADLFAETGWQGFSMRKLGARLGIAAKTLYNYFDSQDELYLGLLTRGFRSLNDALRAAVASAGSPLDRLGALVDAYVAFAFAHANLYGLMFTWHVPKYNDYVGTASEQAARVELEAALENQRLAAQTIAACASAPLSEDDLRLITIRTWSQLHGFIAGVQNHLIDYMHPDPDSLRDRMVSLIKSSIAGELAGLCRAVAAGEAVQASHAVRVNHAAAASPAAPN